MATALGFRSSITRHSTWFKREIKDFHHTIPVKTLHQLQKPGIEMVPQLKYTKRVVKRKPWKLFVVPPGDLIGDSISFSPAQTIMLFYSAINEKNIKQLDKLIADDCLFDDYSFSKPFQGKKVSLKQEVLRFLEQLIMCMGQNMQFNVEHIWEGNDYAAGVNWHLDWNKIQVPFTRGCSNYSLLVNGDRLVIRKAQVIVEPPIKLGPAALTMFKIVSSLFDAFPAATEWFLKSPHIVFRLVLKTFSIVVKPIVSPFIAWYLRILNLAVCILSFTMKILHYLAKIFHTS